MGRWQGRGGSGEGGGEEEGRRRRRKRKTTWVSSMLECEKRDLPSAFRIPIVHHDAVIINPQADGQTR